SEYGDPDVAEEFAWLRAYSPYHHVVDGTPYPAVLLTCATGDSRVHPLHARKMTAALQHATSSAASDRPVLLVEERDAGHGVGKPVHLRAAEVADALTFLADQLGWSIADAS
nr:S9 family peptidase [Acidimicrobiia bacterium]